MCLFGSQNDRLGSYDHVILAVPAVPIRNIDMALPADIQTYISGVIPFPLVKVFVVLKKHWWPHVPQPQEGTHLIPTREIHYKRKGERCMIMFYMDRPGTAFWRPYVHRPHTKAQVGLTSNADLLEEIVSQISRLLPSEGLPESEHRIRVRSCISNIAIRDWSEAPFGAACHAWLPNLDVPRALSRLKAFGLVSGGKENSRKNVHVCGEAYSDYQGFIEGSLRSAESVLATI